MYDVMVVTLSLVLLFLSSANAASNFSQVSCGYVHTVSIATNGSFFSWGDNYYSQLGVGNVSKWSLSPVLVGGLLTGKKIIQVSTKEYSTIALSSDGLIFSWGDNQYGQLGDGTSTLMSQSPVLALPLENEPNSTQPPLTGTTAGVDTASGSPATTTGSSDTTTGSLDTTSGSLDTTTGSLDTTSGSPAVLNSQGDGISQATLVGAILGVIIPLLAIGVVGVFIFLYKARRAKVKFCVYHIYFWICV